MRENYAGTFKSEFSGKHTLVVGRGLAPAVTGAHRFAVPYILLISKDFSVFYHRQGRTYVCVR